MDVVFTFFKDKQEYSGEIPDSFLPEPEMTSLVQYNGVNHGSPCMIVGEVMRTVVRVGVWV